MSGSGGSSGYNYQARAIAYVGAHILAQRRLDWIDHLNPDIPVIVATETGGPGDDLQITLQDGIKVEIQAKKKLRYDQEFWDALVRLAFGLVKEPYLYGVLLIGPKSTGKIKDELREDFEHLGANGSSELRQITQEVIKRFHQEGIKCDTELFRRLKLIQANFQDSSPEVKFAYELLAQVILDSNQAKNAWKALDSEGHQLIELKGKRNAIDLARRLSNIPIQLSATAENLIIIAEHYKDYLRRTTAYFSILGFNTKFSIESAWIQLQASNSKGFDKAFNADFIPDAYHRLVVTAKSGSGKSTLLQRIAHRLSNLEKQVLWVRLPQVVRYFKQGKTFAEAILTDAAEKSGIEISQLKRILANPDCLLIDGLDECDSACLGVITQALLKWSVGHSNTKIIITTRSDSHTQGLFPDWNYVELLPFGLQNVRELAQQLLEARFTDETHIEQHLALFEHRLAVNKTASLAAQNPLLAGFLVQLSIDDVELAQNRAELYESIIELLYNQSLPNREFKIDYDRSTAFRIIEITGWILQNSSDLSEHKLVEKLGQELVNELGLKLLAAKREAQQGLDFWKERRVIEYQKTGRESTVTFIHLSLQEYAAGKYAAFISSQELKEWLMRVRQESKWKEVILFASGAGAVELIVTHLLALSDSDESASPELILAAEALAETQIHTLKLLDEVVKRLQLQLESPLSDRAFEAAEALSLLASKAPDVIGTVTQALVNHAHFWTRLSATKLLLECGESYVNLEALLKLLDEIVAEPAKAPEIYCLLNKTRKKAYKNWEFQNQVVCKGFQLLIKKQPNLTVANQMWDFISQGRFSFGTCQTLREILSDILPDKLENKDSQEYQGWSLLFWKLTRPDRILAEHSLEKLLGELRQREKAKLADQIFLESILHATNHSESSLLQEPRDLVNLGILFKGMGWWELAITDRDSLSERQDLEAVETVIRGTILVLNIDEEYLAADALWVLNEIKSLPFYENLDTIEAILNTEEDSEYRRACLKQLLEIKINDRYCYLHHRIPEEVPVNLKWERAKNIPLDSEKLLRALEHPSEGIRQNAALLLLNGAGGDEAANLVRQLLEDD